jgi:hypothetical protein
MCTLPEPVPSLFIAWFHPDPTVLLIFGGFSTFLFGFLLLEVWSSPDSRATRLSRKQAALLMVGGYVCWLVAWYWPGLLAPYSQALDAWYQQEQGVLSQACVSTVVTPAYYTARHVVEKWTDGVTVPFFVLGGLCLVVAFWSRNLRVWGAVGRRQPPSSPLAY